MPSSNWRKKHPQIAVYPPPILLKKLKDEAVRRNRKLGPTVLEILHRYFFEKERDYPKYADT